MAFSEKKLTTVGQIQTLIQANKTEIDALELRQSTLDARMDAQVTASTDGDADYAAETVDGRVDYWGNTQGSLGTNIRNGQKRLAQELQQVKEGHQEQIKDIAQTQLGEAVILSETLEKRRTELESEKEQRIAGDRNLYHQVQDLSNAILEICCQISKIKDLIRTLQEE